MSIKDLPAVYLSVLFASLCSLLLTSSLAAANDHVAQLSNKPPIDQNSDQAKLPSDQSVLPTSDDSWLDNSRSYVSASTDDLANWVDRFFGTPRTDIESAYSSLRLSVESEWEEGVGFSEKVRLRGNVHLPRVNERLSLVFTDESGDELSQDSDINQLAEDSSSSKVGLEYNIREKRNSRLDFRVGIRSSGRGKARIRYKYQLPWGEKMLHRFTEHLYFVDGDGFGLSSRYELDRSLADDRLFRWSNTVNVAEEFDGVEWSSRWLVTRRLGNSRALTNFIWVNGETRPESLTKSYGVGMKYRENFYRDWLFYEVKPAYAWKRDSIEENREGTALITFGIEALIEN